MDIYYYDRRKNIYLIPLCFLLGIVYAWGVLWVINIFEWLESITIGDLLGTLFWADARGPLYIIHTFVVMIPYIIVLPAAVMAFKYVRGIWPKRIMALLMAPTLIYLFDPTMAAYSTEGVRLFFDFFHDKCYCHLLGGASFANLTWSDSVGKFEYTVFDVYVVISAILCAFNKDNFDIC